MHAFDLWRAFAATADAAQHNAIFPINRERSTQRARPVSTVRNARRGIGHILSQIIAARPDVTYC